MNTEPISLTPVEKYMAQVIQEIRLDLRSKIQEIRQKI